MSAPVSPRESLQAHTESNAYFVDFDTELAGGLIRDQNGQRTHTHWFDANSRKYYSLPHQRVVGAYTYPPVPAQTVQVPHVQHQAQTMPGPRPGSMPGPRPGSRTGPPPGPPPAKRVAAGQQMLNYANQHIKRYVDAEKKQAQIKADSVHKQIPQVQRSIIRSVHKIFGHTVFGSHKSDIETILRQKICYSPDYQQALLLLQKLKNFDATLTQIVNKLPGGTGFQHLYTSNMETTFHAQLRSMAQKVVSQIQNLPTPALCRRRVAFKDQRYHNEVFMLQNAITVQ